MNSYKPVLDGSRDMVYGVKLTFQTGAHKATVFVEIIGDIVGAETLAEAMGGEDGDIEGVLADASEYEENEGLIDVEYNGDPSDPETEYTVKLKLKREGAPKDRILDHNFLDFLVGVEIVSCEEDDEEDDEDDEDEEE